MGYEIGDLWKKLALRLNLELKIPDIDNQHEQQFEKAYQMPLEWKRRNAINATYIILHAALEDVMVGGRDLAEKYCLEG